MSSQFQTLAARDHIQVKQYYELLPTIPITWHTKKLKDFFHIGRQLLSVQIVFYEPAHNKQVKRRKQISL